jgi:hypothetical protein
VHLHTPSAEADLRDLLDRILDKGLFVGAENLLVLGELDLSSAQSRVSFVSMHIHIGYHPVRQTLCRYPRKDKRML